MTTRITPAKKCSVCGIEGYMIEHHTSYIPEKTVFVCNLCHKKVHAQNPELKPPKGFYPHMVTFEPTAEQWERIKHLPREVNLTKEMRSCLDKLLANKLLPKRLVA